MRLCLFYPQFLTMRLMGYRQQAIRKCVAGGNISFLPDGTVILHFMKREVKNKRELHMEIRPTEGGIHERLRTVLTSAFHSRATTKAHRRPRLRLRPARRRA
jgi:hypothetical protein